MEEQKPGYFNTEGETKYEDEMKPLVNESFSYDNIVNNPIIKPIAEADKRIRDLRAFLYKRLAEMNRVKMEVNATLLNVPEYQNSLFVGKLLNLIKDASDIVMFQDQELKIFINCINEMLEINNKKYGVLVEEVVEVKPQDSKEKAETIDYKSYLEGLISNQDKDISDATKKILAVFDEDKTTPDEKIRFQNACTKVYKDEEDKQRKTKYAKIIRMEV